MSHLKRQSVPNRWPIERKGSTYVVKSNFNFENGVPVLIVLRNMLKVAQTRREAKRIIHLRQILLNERPVTDEKDNVLLFDTLSILATKKNYRLEISDNGKFQLNEIKASESDKKIAKIVNKKILKGKKTQLNLNDGRNFISDMKCNTNDSVVVSLKEGKIQKCLPMKEKAKVVIFAGKHMGKGGEIEQINAEEKIAKVKINGKEINILIKQLMVVE